MFNTQFKNEKAPKVKTVFEAGWNYWNVTGIKQEVSKSSKNPMFVITLEHANICQPIDVYAIAVQGKQWLLMQFLKACGIKVEEGVELNWDSSDVLGKTIMGFVQNEDNNWIDREGQSRSDKQSKISNFLPLEKQAQPEMPIEEQIFIPGEEEQF